MSLTGKKYEKFYETTGTGTDKITSDNLTIAEAVWDMDRALGMKYHFDNLELAPIVFQLQQMQDELDYLRTEISTNKDKTGITTAQARDIASNKTNVGSNVTEIAKLTRSKLNMTSLPYVQPNVEQAVECGVVYDSKTKTYSMTFVYSETTTPKGGKATTVTRTGSIQLK